MTKASITYARASVVKQGSPERLQIKLSCRTNQSNQFYNLQFLLSARHREYNSTVIDLPDFLNWQSYREPTNRAKASDYACFIGRGYEVARFQPGRSQPRRAIEQTCAIIEIVNEHQYNFTCWIKHQQLEIQCIREFSNERYTHQGQYIKLDQENTTKIDWL